MQKKRVMHMHPRSWGENFLNNVRPVLIVVQQKEMDRVGFEPTTSAMPMPYPTGLDDRPCNNSRFWNDIKMIRL
jgi:hypothetical protein